MKNRLDFHRKRRGPTGILDLLRFLGQGEYEVLLEISDGWSCWYDQTQTVNDLDTFLSVEVEETATMNLNEELAGEPLTVLQAFQTAEVLRAGRLIFQIQKEHTRPPLLKPRNWSLRAYYINATGE